MRNCIYIIVHVIHNATVSTKVIYQSVVIILYLCYRSRNAQCNGEHKGHLSVSCNYIAVSLRHLLTKVDQNIIRMITEKISTSIISKLVLQQFGRVINEVRICHCRDNL